jgi:cupin 2 domain-containing protein
MRIDLATLLAACVLALCFAETVAAGSYSKAVQKACGADYRKHCGDYGLESAALRVCMDKAGRSLSKSCVNALVQSGEVSQAEVDRRKAAGR